jgi:hypothetical protein
MRRCDVVARQRTCDGRDSGDAPSSDLGTRNEIRCHKFRRSPSRIMRGMLNETKHETKQAVDHMLRIEGDFRFCDFEPNAVNHPTLIYPQRLTDAVTQTPHRFSLVSARGGIAVCHSIGIQKTGRHSENRAHCAFMSPIVNCVTPPVRSPGLVCRDRGFHRRADGSLCFL